MINIIDGCGKWINNSFWQILNLIYAVTNWTNGLFIWFNENGEYKFRCFILIIALLGIIINAYFVRNVLYINKIKYNKYLYKNEMIKALSLVIVLILLGCSLKGIAKEDTYLGMLKVTSTSFTSIIAIILYVLCLLQKVIFYRKVSDVNKEILGFLLNASYLIVFISALNQFHAVIIPVSLIVTIINFNAMKKAAINNNDLNGVDLYETRKRQLVELNEIIQEENNFAIALNGEWGSGKSEFFKVYMQEYKDLNHYIYIKPMMTDTRESLINQFKKSLIDIMKKDGIYVGNKSTANKYFKEVIKLFKGDSKISLDSLIGEEEEKTYMDLKKEVEKDIENLIRGFSSNEKSNEEKKPKKKLIVIIDDFDRIDQDKQEIILHFIKEIIDFKGCIVMFALDYNNIKQNSKIDRTYLEKFVKSEMLLSPIDFAEIIRFHGEEILNHEKVSNKISKALIKEIKEKVYEHYSEMENRIYKYIETCEVSVNKGNESKVENQDYNKKLKPYFREKRRKLNNSRRVIHFLNAMQNTIQKIDKIYVEGSIKLELLKNINAGEIIYFFNFLKVFDNEIYDDIINSGGVDEYISDLKNKIDNAKDTSEDEEIKLLYFKLILGEIIIDENKAINPKTQLKRRNQLRFFNDIFIDCNLTEDNIALINNVDTFLEMLNDIEIGHELGEYSTQGIIPVEALDVVLNEMYEQISSEDEIIRVSKNFGNYLLKCAEDEILKLSDIINILNGVKNSDNLKYFKYILDPVKNIIYSNIKMGYSERNKILSNVIILSNTNVIEYKPIFVQYLSLVDMLDNYKVILNSDEMELREVNNIGSLCRVITTSLLSNESIDYNTKEFIESKKEEIIELIEVMEKIIYKNNYSIIDINLLKDKMNEFKENYNLIYEINYVIENSLVDLDQERYTEMARDWKLYFGSEAYRILKDLSERAEYTDEMIYCFQNIMISLINGPKENLNRKTVIYCKTIYDNIKYLKDKNVKFYLSVSVILEALLHASKSNTDIKVE